MKPKSALRNFLALAGSSILAISSASAITLYWDGATPAGAPGGGAGTWDTSLTNWDNTPSADSSTVWDNTNIDPNFVDIAVFGGTASTSGSPVQLGSTISIGGLRFDTTAYFINSTGHSLNFAATNNTILFNNNIAAASITGPVGGSGNVILSTATPGTAGTLTLNGTSTGGWSGTTTINAGMTMALAADNRALANTSGITLNGGNITVTNTTATEAGYDRINNGAGITSNGGTFTWTNTAASARQYAETIGSVALNRGQTDFLLATNQNGGGAPTNSQILTLSGLTRASDATSVVSFNGGLNTTTNQIVISGYAQGFMGPWAYLNPNHNIANVNDYASVNASGQVVAANIAATLQDSASWTAGGNNVTLGANTTLTGNRNLNTLRTVSGVTSLNLGGFTLETSGVLSGQNVLTISNGVLTTASGGGNLYITPGWSAQNMTISAAINNNGGAVTLVKSGAAQLTLSGANDFTGGIVVNAGTLLLTGTQSYTGGITLNGGIFGNSTTALAANTFNSNNITVNGTAAMAVANGVSIAGNVLINSTGTFRLGTPSGTAQIDGVLSGTGILDVYAPGGSGSSITLANTANTFTGGVLFSAGNNGGFTLAVNSLLDTASSGAGNIVMGNGGAASTQTFALHTGAVAPLTLTNRQFEIQGPTASGQTLKIANNSSQAFTINSDLNASAAKGVRTLTLGGTGTGLSTFVGTITNGGLTTLNLSKADSGTWRVSSNLAMGGALTVNAGTLLLGGTNSYTGTLTTNTLVANTALIGGTTVFQGLQALPSSSTIYTQDLSSTNGSISLLDDGTNLDRSGVNILKQSLNTAAGAMNIFVGNNGTANLGSNASSTATGNTISIGSLSYYTNNGTSPSVSTNVTGANGYRLLINGINLNNRVTTGATAATANYTTTLNPTTAPLTLAGTITQLSGAIATSGSMTLDLGGTAKDNRVTGNIQNAADFGSNANAKALALTKTGTSDWNLSGTNSYTGGTTITTGKLLFSGANALPTTGTIAVGANGILSLADGTARNQTVSALTLTSLGSLSFDWTGSGTGDQLTSTANITPTAASRFVVNLNRSGTPAGPLTLLTGGASSTLSSSTFYLANLTDYTATLTTPTANTLVVDNYAAQSALTTMYWQGDKLGTGVAGVRNAWALSDGTTSNWSSTTTGYTGTALTPGATANVIFANGQVGKTQQSTVLGSDVTVNSVVIDDGTAVTIAGANGAALTLMSNLSAAGLVDGTPGSAITVTSTANATSTISSRVNLGANQTWNVASGKTLAVSGIVDGAFSLTKADAGTLTLSGANTYTGTTAINVGQVTISNANALGTTAGNTTIAATGSTATGGRLSFAAGFTTLAENITITGTSNNSATSAINNSGQATVTLSGDITLSSLTGGIRFDTNNSGSNMIFSGTISQTVSSEALIFSTNSSGGQTITVNNSIALNGGTLQVQGTGTSVLRGVNATDGTGIGQTNIVAGGTLRLGVSNALNTTATLTADGTFALTGFDQTVNALVGASTGIVSNTVAGTRTLTVGNGGGSGTFNGMIVTGVGDIQLIKTGSGTQTLSGINTYTGGTIINAGTVSIENSSSLGSESSGLTIGAGATLQVTHPAEVHGFSTSRATVLGGAGGGVGGTIDIVGHMDLDYASGSSITGTGSLIKTGAGTLLLQGTNTFTGGLYMKAGIVAANSQEALGAVPTAGSSNYGLFLYDGATFQVRVNSWSTYRELKLMGDVVGGLAKVDITEAYTHTRDGRIWGDGKLNLVGTGKLIVTAANTYTGGTLINSGTLQVGNSTGSSATGTGAVTVASGGTLQGSATASKGFISGAVTVQSGGHLSASSGATLTLEGGLSLADGSLGKFSLGALTATPLVNITGTFLANSGTSTFEIVNTGTMGVGTYSLFDYAGAFSNFGNLALAQPHTGLYNLSLVHNTGNTSIDLAVTAIEKQWKKGGVNTNWSNTANWWTGEVTGVPNGVDEEVLFINNNGAGFDTAEAVTVNSNITAGSIAFNSTTAFTIAPTSAETLTLDVTSGNANISVNSAPTSANHVISAALILADNLTANIASGTYGLDISGAISGSGKTLNKTGDGTLILSGTAANTYDSLTTVEAGKLKLNKTAGVNAIGSGGLEIASGATVALQASNQIADTASLVVSGTFALGTHSETIAGLTSTGSVTIGSGGVLTIHNTVNSSFAGIISGEGGIAKSGTHTLLLNGHNEYTGGTAINGGILQVSEDLNLGGAASNLTFNGGTLSYAGDFSSARSVTLSAGGGTFDTNNRTATLSGVISGSGALTKISSGTLTVSGNNDYTGATTISGGTLEVQGSIASSSGITNNAALIFDSDSAQSYGNVIGGIGSLTKSGTGTLTLSGTNTYTGATTVTEGTLEVGGGGSINNSAVTVNTGGTFLYNSSVAYTGTLTLEGGTLGGSGSVGNLTIDSGGAIDLTGATLGLNSTGILTLSGGNLTLGNLTFQDIVGWNWENAAAGTYKLIAGDFTIDWGSTAYLNEGTAYDFGNGKKGYFTLGSLNAVIIPEPRAALLGGIGMLLLLRRRRN